MADYVVKDSSLTAVADAIREQTGETGELVFPEGFVAAIGDISGGGGFTPPEDEILTPELVYKTTRPSGWLKMPTPTDQECYCLGHIFPGTTGYFNATITFTGTCVVEFGSVVDGVFVAKESYSPTSGTFFSKAIQYNNYGDELADGTRQYMVRIYGTIIYKLDFCKLDASFSSASIVDIVCGIALDRCVVGNYNYDVSSLYSLKYLNFVGKGKPGWINGSVFASSCNSLLSIGCEAKNTSDWAGYACAFNETLLAVSPNIFAGVKNSIAFAFRNAKITGIKLGSIKPTDTNTMFAGSSLQKFSAETLDTSLSTNMGNMFDNCRSLQSVTDLNMSSVTNVSNMFAVCYSLARLTFAGDTTPGGYTISLTGTSLDHDALVEMIASLPTATSAATITIAGVPGASALTDAEIAVATAKNWTITR